ncbi:MAG: alpha/beta fold hydrolase [Rubellimicrobium sp.]|nr:alpha/beta fold hydrolase [Rubellimicrobium sp.]
MIWVGIVLLVLVILLVLWPDLAEARRGLPDQSRAPGDIVALPQGATHALWHGPARGPVIVAIHGHATPSPLWDALTPGLADLGYRVLTYDLYGRGYSDNARGEQTPEFFRQQLDALLDHYGLGEDLTLLGHGLGGAIATDWAAANPGRVKRLVLIAPSGVAATNPRGLRLVRDAKGIGDRLFIAAAPRILRRRMGGTPELAALCEGELQRRGFLRAALSSLRHMGQQQEQAHRSLAQADVPVVAIWGDADTTVPQRAPGTLAEWNRAAKQETVAGGGHYLPVTHPEQVAALLRDVLREDWE